VFEAAELGHKLSKEAFKEQEAGLRLRLLNCQLELGKSTSPVIIIVSGVQGAGKGAVVNRLNEWLDTRGLENWSFWEQSDEENERPKAWRYWRVLPARGTIGIFFGAWYNDVIDDAYLCMDDGRVETQLNRIDDLERMLSQDGAKFVKLWYHLPRKEQKDRLEQSTHDQQSYWNMAKEYTGRKKEYARFMSIAERIVRATDTGVAPWHIIEATDNNYRDIRTGELVCRALEEAIRGETGPAAQDVHDTVALGDTDVDDITVLDTVDLSQRLEKKEYRNRLAEMQGVLTELAWEAYRQQRACILVFEGWDAAGKGGAIRRVTQAVDARLRRTISVAAPTDEELAHHYLWRFWRYVPRAGHMRIFDRSWYGRVLVERVEGFATPLEWQAAYRQINSFEEQLTERGDVLLKFWVHISKEEQLNRFQLREQTPYKQHKITDEDWRNREKWDLYREAVDDMVSRTSTEFAPWYLIPGDNKRFARVEVITTVVRSLRKALGG